MPAPGNKTTIKLPNDVDRVAAMAFACAGPTMVHALLERRPVRLGETCSARQRAGWPGCRGAGPDRWRQSVIIAGGPAKRLELAKAAGIGDYHIDVVSADDIPAALSEVVNLTNGGADLVIECTGNPTAVGQGLQLARRGGSYLIVGQYTDSGDTVINPHQIVYRQLDVVGSLGLHRCPPH